MTTLRFFGPFLVFVAAMLWATDAPFRVYLTADLSSSFIVLGEHLVSVLIVLPLLFSHWRDFKALSLRQWAAVLVIAIGGSALASIAFTEAFRYVSPSVAILLQKLQPLIAIGLSAILLKEPLGKGFWLFATLALIGAYLVSFPSLVPSMYPGEQLSFETIGVLLALTAALLWGASTVLGRYLLGSIDFKAMTALRFSFAFVFLLALAGAQGTISEAARMSSTDALFIVIVALVSGVASLFIYYRGLSETRASIATIAELGFPLAAVMINWIVLDVALLPMQLAGAALLLFAVYRLALENARAERSS